LNAKLNADDAFVMQKKQIMVTLYPIIREYFVDLRIQSFDIAISQIANINDLPKASALTLLGIMNELNYLGKEFTRLEFEIENRGVYTKHSFTTASHLMDCIIAFKSEVDKFKLVHYPEKPHGDLALSGPG